MNYVRLVFYKRHPPGKEREAEHQKIVDTWDKYRERNLGRGAATPPALSGVQPGQQVNHLTPKGAGGCPTGDGNLQAHEKLCAVCKQIDQDFNEFQS